MNGDFWDKSVNSLQHFGILGMKWGRRKAKKIITPSKEHATKEGLKKKKLAEMSNAELKTLNERLQLEKQYKELNKAHRSKGTQFALKFLETQGNQILSRVISQQLNELMKKAM
jgi:hypothetical protein